jgi:hypothetical protein
VTVLTSDPESFLRSPPSDPALLTQVPAGVEILRAGPLRLWDGQSGACLASLEGHTNVVAGVQALADGRLFGDSRCSFDEALPLAL